MAKIDSRMMYVYGLDGFGNIIEHGRTPLGDYMVTIQGRVYATFSTHDEAVKICSQLVNMGKAVMIPYLP